MINVDFSELLGKTIHKIDGMEKGSEHVFIYCTDGTFYILEHEQECCEAVWLDDVVGEVDDLLDSPITLAELTCKSASTDDESFTWSFYKLATANGYVTLRWYGTSNGYYSEEVSFIRGN